MPVGRGDPLKKDPTYDYSPPVLEHVRYWAADVTAAPPPTASSSTSAVASPSSSFTTGLQQQQHQPSAATSPYYNKNDILLLGVSAKRPYTHKNKQHFDGHAKYPSPIRRNYYPPQVLY